MRAVTKPLDEQARSIFAELGYTVTTRGEGFLAERKWRAVHVTPATEAEDAGVPGESGDGEYRCFVTWADHVDRLEQRLTGADPDYDWAIIGVEDDGGYEVCRRLSAA